MDNTSIKKQRGNEGERLPSTCKEPPNQSSCSPRCSSPVHVDSIPPELTMSPIKERDEGQQRGEVPKSTNVFVKVEWPSKNAERKLPSDLESLEKMLVRGTYKQVANAAWKNINIKKQLKQLMLSEINR